MRRFLFGLAAVAMLVTPAAAADGDLTGWHGFTFGQKLEDFRKDHPCESEVVQGDITVCRIAGAIKLEGLNLGQTYSFTASEGLIQITLSAGFSDDATGDATDDVWARIGSAFARHYGQAFFIPPTGRFRSGAMVWRFPSGASVTWAVSGLPPKRLLTAIFIAANGLHDGL